MINKFIRLFAAAVILTGCSNAQNNTPLPECEWCGTGEAPGNVSWQTVINPKDEPGEPLIISGTVYKSDKTTPAPDVILYVYHTNSGGIYPKLGNETGNGRRHGYLRSWMRTNSEGKFQFSTIRPGSYPNSSAPQHIHMTVKEKDKDEYYINDILFDDDPFVSGEHRLKENVITLSKDNSNTWTGTHNIILKD